MNDINPAAPGPWPDGWGIMRCSPPFTVFVEDNIELLRITADGVLLIGGPSPDLAFVSVNLKTGDVALRDKSTEAARIFWKGLETVIRMTMSTRRLLRPCRICGFRPPQDFAVHAVCGTLERYVWCEGCKGRTGEYETEQEARDAWNRGDILPLDTGIEGE